MVVLEIKYTVEPSSTGELKVYIGDNVGKNLYGDGSYAWTMNSDLHVKEGINNGKKRLKEDGLEYNKKLSNVNYLLKSPFSSVDYSPELDISMGCN